MEGAIGCLTTKLGGYNWKDPLFLSNSSELVGFVLRKRIQTSACSLFLLIARYRDVKNCHSFLYNLLTETYFESFLRPPPPPQLQTSCYTARYYVKNSTCAWGRKNFKPTELGGGQNRIDPLILLLPFTLNKFNFQIFCLSAVRFIFSDNGKTVGSFSVINSSKVKLSM